MYEVSTMDVGRLERMQLIYKVRGQDGADGSTDAAASAAAMASLRIDPTQQIEVVKVRAGPRV